MVDGWEKLNNGKKIGSRFSQGTLLFQHAYAPYAPASQRLSIRGFFKAKESQDHRNSNLELGENLNFTQSWCVQGYFDDKNSQA